MMSRGLAASSASAVCLACANIPPIAGGIGWRPSHMITDGESTAIEERSLASSFVLEARSYPPLDERYYVGAEQSLGTEFGTGCCDLWRGNALMGWVLAPVRPAGRWFGAELTLPALGFGKIPVRRDFPTAFGFGGRLGLLFKIPWFSEECNAHDLVAYRTLAVLEGGATGFAPLQGTDVAIQTEAFMTLGARIDLSVLP